MTEKHYSRKLHVVTYISQGRCGHTYKDKTKLSSTWTEWKIHCLFFLPLSFLFISCQNSPFVKNPNQDKIMCNPYHEKRTTKFQLNSRTATQNLGKLAQSVPWDMATMICGVRRVLPFSPNDKACDTGRLKATA